MTQRMEKTGIEMVVVTLKKKRRKKWRIKCKEGLSTDTNKINLIINTSSVLLNSCTTWTLMKCLEQKLDGNYICMPAVFKQILEAATHKTTLPPISQTIQVRWTKYVGHCWRSRQIHKQCDPMDFYTWAHQCWLTSKNSHSSALYRNLVLSRGLTKCDSS